MVVDVGEEGSGVLSPLWALLAQPSAQVEIWLGHFGVSQHILFVNLGDAEMLEPLEVGSSDAAATDVAESVLHSCKYCEADLLHCATLVSKPAVMPRDALLACSPLHFRSFQAEAVTEPGDGKFWVTVLDVDHPELASPAIPEPAHANDASGTADQEGAAGVGAQGPSSSCCGSISCSSNR